MKKVVIHRFSCRACNEVFCGLTLEEAKKKHQEHIKTCDIILGLEKIEGFRRKCEEILGRKMTFKEASKLLMG